MVIAQEDKAFIENFYLIKGYGLQKLMRGFLGKDGKVTYSNNF